jgi:hypothetical protein
MNLRACCAALLAMLLAACASSGGPLVMPGPNPAGGDLRIDSEMEWSRYSEMRSQVWTIDGQQLNLLYLLHGVREGEYIFLGRRQTRRRPDGAFFRSGMRADEVRDLIVDGLLAAGLVGVRTQDLRPDDFAGREGLRFEMTMTNQEGLKYQGMAAAFEHDNQLALALFMAPGEYYYPRDAAKVSRMLDTLRLE